MTHLVLETPLEQEQRAHLRVVRDSSEALLGVVNSLLDFSKIDAGRLEVESRNFDLRACVGGVLRAMAMGAAEKNLALIGDVASEVPHNILGDETRLRQTLLNLVGNAIKFTESGQVYLRVTQVAAQPGSDPNPDSESDSAGAEIELAFSVQDTGIGIPADKLEEVFVAFKQADASTSRRFGGTGLGLPISQRLVGLMGGALTCESEPGRGSTFHFTLPTRAAPTTQCPMYKHEIAALTARQLVVVEPNPTACATLTQMAKSWGMEVVAAPNLTRLSTLLRTSQLREDALVMINGDFGGQQDSDENLRELILKFPSLSHRTLMLLSVTVPRSRRQQLEKLGVRHVTTPALDSDLRPALAEVATAGKVKRKSSDPVPGPRIEKPRLKILVVDDSPSNRLLAVGLLRRHAEVSVAHDGRHALEMLDQQDFELVLMDVHMPVMDGLEATQTLRRLETKTGGHMPIIALTAGATSKDRALCMEAGMDDFLDKPIRPQLLYTKINSLMREQSGVV
ncbi:MAG: response regulator, partial [Nannocystaceae bacterium]